jgi:hypothetical protein
MAELADAADSKSAEGNLVGVRPPLPAPQQNKRLTLILPLENRGAKNVWWLFVFNFSIRASMRLCATACIHIAEIIVAPTFL